MFERVSSVGNVLVVPPFECAWLSGNHHTLRNGSGCIVFEAKGDTDVTVILKSTPGAKRWQPLASHRHQQGESFVPPAAAVAAAAVGANLPAGGADARAGLQAGTLTAAGVEENYTVIMGSHRNTCLKFEKNGRTFCSEQDAPGSRVSGREFRWFWIDYNSGVITVGTGNEAGQGPNFRWQDPSGEISNIQHIGLSCWDRHVSYRNIQVLPALTSAMLRPRPTGRPPAVPSLLEVASTAAALGCTPPEVCLTLRVAELLLPSTRALYREGLAYLAVHFADVASYHASELIQLSPELMHDLLQHPALATDEHVIFSSVAAWAVAQLGGNAATAASSTGVVRSGDDGKADGGGKEHASMQHTAAALPGGASNPSGDTVTVSADMAERRMLRHRSGRARSVVFSPDDLAGDGAGDSSSAVASNAQVAAASASSMGAATSTGATAAKDVPAAAVHGQGGRVRCGHAAGKGRENGVRPSSGSDSAQGTPVRSPPLSVAPLSSPPTGNMLPLSKVTSPPANCCVASYAGLCTAGEFQPSETGSAGITNVDESCARFSMCCSSGNANTTFNALSGRCGGAVSASRVVDSHCASATLVAADTAAAAMARSAALRIRDEHIARVLALVRFPLIQPDRLHTILTGPLAQRMPGMRTLVEEALGLCQEPPVSMAAASVSAAAQVVPAGQSSLDARSLARVGSPALPATAGGAGGTTIERGRSLFSVENKRLVKPADAEGTLSFVRYQRRCLPLGHECSYVCDGDRNGIFHHLGTAGGTQQWVNPASARLVEVKASSPTARTTDPKALLGGQFLRTNFAGPRYLGGGSSASALSTTGSGGLGSGCAHGSIGTLAMAGSGRLSGSTSGGADSNGGGPSTDVARDAGLGSGNAGGNEDSGRTANGHPEAIAPLLQATPGGMAAIGGKGSPPLTSGSNMPEPAVRAGSGSTAAAAGAPLAAALCVSAGGAWWAVDLLNYELITTYYSIRHDGSQDYARHWALQASKDGASWTDLRCHANDATLQVPGQWASYPVGGASIMCGSSATASGSVANSSAAFRHFRLQLTGPTTSTTQPHNFHLSAFELYGFLFKAGTLVNNGQPGGASTSATTAALA